MGCEGRSGSRVQRRIQPVGAGERGGSVYVGWVVAHRMSGQELSSKNLGDHTEIVMRGRRCS